MSSCDLDYVVDETGFPPGSPDKLNWMMEGIIKIRSFFLQNILGAAIDMGI